MEVGKRHGDLPAHQPFLSASSHGNRVAIGFRRSHFTLLKEEGESVTLLAISGGTGGRSFPGKRTCGRMMSFVYNIRSGLWLVLKVGGAFVGPEEWKKGRGTAARVHTHACAHTHDLGYLCAI